MKKIVLFAILSSICISSFAQKKKDIIKEIKAYKKSIVSTASYEKEFSEVWDAMYIIATEEYNTITRESESRGYIEAKQEKDTYKEHITIEVRGDKSPYRVSFQVKQERRTKQQDGTYTNWDSFTSFSLKSYYLKLQIRLYELLNGSFKLSDELQIKIDEHNAKQKKDRKKILKGKDY